ncbi:MAG TPA: gephyrin-like molybdotransferase Glp [Phnomibacter sp.]|nr:gephyrin-like molybdotransferase Glp [Phnomibacter sp.]
MQYMISAEEATQIISNSVQPMPVVHLPLQNAKGLVLAQDTVAAQDIPAYPQSSMDGYAIAFDEHNRRYKIVGEMQAGSNTAFAWQPGTTVRIFTGAAVPPGADTVVIQEKVQVENGEIIIEQHDLKYAANVRPVGSEIEKDTIALQKGDLLTPAAIGFLAGIGFSDVPVYVKPVVQVIVTGNELQTPGSPLQYGQVFESNSFALQSALAQLQIGDVAIHRAPDDLEILQQQLAQALAKSDVVLLTGGVSVGDYDFTLKAMEACGVQPLFHKIKQKPGKPILFGVKGRQLVFGLPGNPASVLTCFYRYVWPALEQMMQKKPSMVLQSAVLATPYKKAAALTHFLKANFDGEKLHLLTGQESYKLHSFARANSIAIVPEDVMELKAGDTIQFYLLPQ